MKPALLISNELFTQLESIISIITVNCFIFNSTYIQQHCFNLANALIQPVERSFNGLKDSLILLQRHQTLFHQLSQRSFARLVAFKLRVQQGVGVDKREDCIANFLITEKCTKKNLWFCNILE